MSELLLAEELAAHRGAPSRTVGGEAVPPPRRTLRIAVVTETYPPEVNGVASTTARMVEGLRDRGHDVQLVRPRQAGHDIDRSRPADPRREALMPSWPIPCYRELRMGLPSRRRLVSLWTARRPDVVHITTEGPLGWSALRAAETLALPVTSDFRTNFQAYSAHYGIGWLERPIAAYLRSFHNRTRCTMVPTEALVHELGQLGMQRLVAVPRGVDTADFDPAWRCETLRAAWGAGPRTPVALCVGRLAPEKNLGVVLEAYAAMRRVRPEMKLLFVGDGPERAALAARCPEAIFAGRRSGEDLARHYASADIFLFASLTETFGNVVPEAMASGLAVVAFEHAAAAQLIRSGDNGLVAHAGDVPHFIEQAVLLALDREGASAMGRAARITAQAHGWPRVIAQIETALTAAMREPGVESSPTLLAPIRAKV